MIKETESDLMLTALAVEAERRRKSRGMIRYNYGDLVADTTPEERQEILRSYKKQHARRGTGMKEWFAETDDEKDLLAFCKKSGS